MAGHCAIVSSATHHPSVLSRGLARYGREELLVTADGDDTEVAVQFVWTRLALRSGQHARIVQTE
jgi:hypothetical protein